MPLSVSLRQYPIDLKSLGLTDAELSRMLADFAREQLAEVVASGAAPAQHRTYVDGREGASEDGVRPDGTIRYRFAVLPEIARAALEWLGTQGRVPLRSGKWVNSLTVIDAAGTPIAPEAIAPDADAIRVTDTQPYSRKIQVGSHGFYAYSGRFDLCAAAMRSLYGQIAAFTVAFITLPGGYVLKGRFTHGGLRKDTKAGQPVAYPALVITRL